MCFRSLWCWKVEIPPSLELFNRSLQLFFIVATMFWFFWFQLKKIQIFWISAGSCRQLLSAVSPLLMDYFPAANEMCLIMDLTWKQFLAAALCWDQTQEDVPHSWSDLMFLDARCHHWSLPLFSELTGFWWWFVFHLLRTFSMRSSTARQVRSADH